VTVDVVREWAISAARIADDKKGTDIVVLDVSSVLAITDYFVIASASNSRLVRTIAESVDEELHSGSGIRPLRVEGLREPSWVLLDYGDLVVHVFSDEMRKFYEIERLYRDVPVVEWERTELLAAGE
jgi:ribosome-associated protein